MKTKLFTIFVFLLGALPCLAFALDMPQTPVSLLQMPTDANSLASMAGLGAKAYVVADAQTGQVLISSNPNLSWTPASLTKLVTALVVLDTKPNFSKTVTMAQADQSAGGCSVGGACIKSAPGVKFTVDGLFHAALMPSANNAANALSRSTGLSPAAFVAKMNKKVASLGATSSHFNEPTGMDPTNKITAADYAKIVAAAFSNAYLRQIAGLTSYTLRSSNNSKYNQTIDNTDKLVTDSAIQILGAKTGYLDEAQYNFAALLKTPAGQELSVVVLGEPHLYSAFDETKELASLADEAQELAFLNPPAVLGTSTSVSLLTMPN